MNFKQAIVYKDNCFLIDEESGKFMQFDLSSMDEPIYYLYEHDKWWIPYNNRTDMGLITSFSQDTLSRIHDALVNLSLEKEML